MTTAAAIPGDPLGHPGFFREEEEEEEVVGEERYDSDSDDDDDDVDRYVFLARQPAPAAEASDDDDGAMPGGGGGDHERKRHVSEILAHAPPAAKKARLGLAAPRGASAEESGSEGPLRSAERGILDQGKQNKKRRRCGGEPQEQPAARSNVADLEASEGRDGTAGQKTYVAAAAGAPRRFVCSLCGRCFGSYQALGGHMHLSHTKKAKDAIAIVDGAGHGKEKTAVAASPGEFDGDGKEMFIGAVDYGDHRGYGNIEGEKVTVAITTSHDDTDGTESKFAAGRYHELAAGAIGNANRNSIVRKAQYRCEVCGRECLSGQALGGHMRKHRNLSPHNGGKECRSPEVADGASHGKEKTAGASSPGESDGDVKKTLGAAACRQDVDSSSGDSDSNSNDEEMFIGAADYGDHRGERNVQVEKVTAIARRHDDTDGMESKFVVRTYHELAASAIGNANRNSIVRKAHYRCEVCGRECLSGQALGGHMRRHRKLSPHNGGKERRLPEVADGAGHGQEKTAVAASPGKCHGDGKKALSAAACLQDVRSGDSNSNEEETFIGAANNGDGDATEKKVTFGRCHELAIGNASSIVRKAQYRCEVCGRECFSGQALGGHMRKHRKSSPQDDGRKERRSQEADGITNQRAVVITNSQYVTRFDESMIGWV